MLPRRDRGINTLRQRITQSAKSDQKIAIAPSPKTLRRAAGAAQPVRSERWAAILRLRSAVATKAADLALALLFLPSILDERSLSVPSL